jgi:hypothetical protein
MAIKKQLQRKMFKRLFIIFIRKQKHKNLQNKLFIFIKANRKKKSNNEMEKLQMGRYRYKTENINKLFYGLKKKSFNV